MLLTKQLYFTHAQLRVIATAAFGNVMKKGRCVKHIGLVPACRQLRTEGVFVRMVGNEKAAHISQNHQDVLINGVDVKQVMLHLTDDVSKYPQITTQDGGLIHQSKCMCDALSLLHDFEKSLTIDGVASEFDIHHIANVIKRAQCFG